MAEAESESYGAKIAVGAVVMNRVKSPQWPNTISGVIYQTSTVIISSRPSRTEASTSRQRGIRTGGKSGYERI
jgi:hypothetical protein